MIENKLEELDHIWSAATEFKVKCSYKSDMGALMQVKSVNNKIIMKDFKAQNSINAKKKLIQCAN